MQQIGEKRELSSKEIERAADFFQIGKVFSASFLKSGVINSNYLVVTDKGKFIIRIYGFKEPLEIQSELELLTYLSKKGFPCPTPLNGLLESQKNIACFRYIEGKEIETADGQSLEKIAKLLATLHNLTQGYPVHDREGEGLEVIKCYVAKTQDLFLKSDFRESQIFIDTLKTELQKICLDETLPRGAVHIDVKKENIIENPDRKLFFIDFDNFYEDACVADIGSSLMWFCVEDEIFNQRKAQVFLRAYETIRKLSQEEKAGLPEALKFSCLKQAFKYAYICLPQLDFAEKMAYSFLKTYKNLPNAPIAI